MTNEQKPYSFNLILIRIRFEALIEIQNFWIGSNMTKFYFEFFRSPQLSQSFYKFSKILKKFWIMNRFWIFLSDFKSTLLRLKLIQQYAIGVLGYALSFKWLSYILRSFSELLRVSFDHCDSHTPSPQPQTQSPQSQNRPIRPKRSALKGLYNFENLPTERPVSLLIG